MADSYIQLIPDGTGKRLDTDEITVNSLLVHRERHRVAGLGDGDLAEVINEDPLGTHYGLVVVPKTLISPQFSALNSVAVAAGAEVNLDASTIPAATVGKLAGVLVASSVPCRWEIKTRDGAVLATIGVLFTTEPTLTISWAPPDKLFATLAGNGIDENFRVTVVNQHPFNAADVYATIFWDEE